MSGRYQRIEKAMINDVIMGQGQSPFDQARLNYALYAGPKADFASDLVEYLKNHYVYSSPQCFSMAKVIKHEGAYAWFIQIAVGEIGELILHLPCPLERICFFRNGDSVMRSIKFEEFVKKIGERYGYDSKGMQSE
jgi:hypothetical protein